MAKIALRCIAERIHALGRETRSLDRELARLAACGAPNTMALFGLGPDTAGALLVSIGDNPDRLSSEAPSRIWPASRPSLFRWAKLTGTGCTAAGPGRPTARCMSRSSFASATALAPEPTPSGAAPKASPCLR